MHVICIFEVVVSGSSRKVYVSATVLDEVTCPGLSLRLSQKYVFQTDILYQKAKYVQKLMFSKTKQKMCPDCVLRVRKSNGCVPVLLCEVEMLFETIMSETG